MMKQTHSHKRSLKLSSALKRIVTNERGNTLMMFGAAAGVVVMTGGAAVDISRRALAKEELAAAVDAGVLAACRAWKVSTNATDSAAVKTEQEDQAKKFMAANFDEARYSMALPVPVITYPTTATASSSGAGSFRDQITVKMTVEGNVPTTLMQTIGLSSLKIKAVSECSRSQGGVELSMALDNTGSMNDTIGGTKKIVSLRSATGKMIDLLYGNQDTSPLVRINIIPYAMAVNVGRQLLDFDDTSTADDFVNMDFTGAPSGFQSKSNLFAFNPKSATVTNPSDQSKWYGCVIERDTNDNIALNSNGTSKALDKDADTPSDAFDVRDFPANTIDATTGKNSGKWKPMIQAYNAGTTRPSHSGYSLSGSPAKYNLGTVTGSVNGGNDVNRGGCPAPTVTWKDGLTKTELKTLVANTNYMRPANNTYSDLGMGWALRFMSPEAPLKSDIQYLDRYSADTANPFLGWVKGILLMTDGEIVTTKPIDAADDTDTGYTGYGFRQVGSRIMGYNQALPSQFSTLGALDAESNIINNRLIVAHEQRMLMACKAARQPAGWNVSTNPNKDNDAIRVYTVFFGSTTGSKAQIYRNCAGKDGFFINATNDAELNNAFSNIASDLQNLRLSL
jgi:Flp pilus assembly protein TadG